MGPGAQLSTAPAPGQAAAPGVDVGPAGSRLKGPVAATLLAARAPLAQDPAAATGRRGVPAMRIPFGPAHTGHRFLFPATPAGVPARRAG